MEFFWPDLRYGIRLLLKNRGFTLAAVLTLAIGIGANSTVFSWANATLFNPIPGMAGPGEVVQLMRGVPGHASSVSYPDYLDLRRDNRVFSGYTAFGLVPMSITAGEKPERLMGTLVSANYFDVLSVKPMLGRGFLESEDGPAGTAPVVVIGYDLWKRRFGGNPLAIGQTIHLNNQTFTIVGVAPPEFQGSYTALRSEIWIPLAMEPQFNPSGSYLTDRGTTWLSSLGRLKTGVSREQAQAQMNGVFQSIARENPISHRGRNQITLFPLWRAPGANSMFSIVFPILIAIAGAVLLLTCANVANLMLVRGVSRRQELAIRRSLGASRGRLVSLVLIESMLLSLAGGAAALVLTAWAQGLFMDMAPQSNLPIWVAVHMDRRVLLVTLAVSVATGVLFGILPALRASGANPIGVLRTETRSIAGGRQKARLSSALAVVQISLSLVLLASASLFIRSMKKAQTVNPGFNPDHVLVASYDLFPNGYTREKGIALHRQLLEKIESLPGVRGAALADWVPMGFSASSDEFSPEGYVSKPHESVEAGIAIVSPNYFRVMEIPIVAGREFAAQDGPGGEPVVVVNQTIAQLYWPGQDAVGKRIRIQGEWRKIVGIAQNSDYYGLHDPPERFLYFPLDQMYSPEVTLHVRTAGDPGAALTAVAQALQDLSPGLPLFDVGTLRGRIQAASTIQRVAGASAGVLGILALLLAAVGIYGVIAFSTNQRAREIGIRVALGAKHGDVLRLVLGGGAKLALLGIALGTVAALALARLISSLLFGVSAVDPLTFITIPILLAGVTLLASYLPARRATRVDPLVALHYE